MCKKNFGMLRASFLQLMYEFSEISPSRVSCTYSHFEYIFVLMTAFHGIVLKLEFLNDVYFTTAGRVGAKTYGYYIEHTQDFFYVNALKISLYHNS